MSRTNFSQGYQHSDEMTSLEMVADALDLASSQINSCAVAVRKFGIDDNHESGSVGGRLLDAWQAAYEIEMRLRKIAAEKEAA